MSKKVLLIAMLLFAAGAAQAEEGQLGVTLDVTYMSKLMDKGGEYYRQQGGILETVDIDLWGTGFGVAVGHREATASGYVNSERFDYVLYYGTSLFDDQPYKTNCKIAWVYHHFPDQARKVGNSHESVLSLSCLELFPLGICPFYTVAYETPAGSGYGNRTASGFWHNFGLDCGVKLPGLPGLTSAGGEEQTYHFTADIAYRDGLGGGAVDHDWTHATIGVSTSFEVTEDLDLVPGLYHQISMDDSVCTNDVTYCTLSMKYHF